MLVRASGGSGGRDEAVGHEISCSGNFCQLCGSTPRLLVSRCPSPMAAFHAMQTAAYSSAAIFAFVADQLFFFVHSIYIWLCCIPYTNSILSIFTA